MTRPRKVLNIDWKPDGADILFTVDGAPAARMPAKAFVYLIDNARDLDKLRRKAEVDLYASIKDLGVAEHVRATRLARKGLENDQIAQVMGISDEQLRKLFSWNAGKLASDAFHVEMDKQIKAGHDLVKRKVELNPFGQPRPDRFVFLEVWRVSRMLAEGKDALEIAKALDLDFRDFQAWLSAHKEILAIVSEMENRRQQRA